MQTLVTGGGGFLGSAIVRMLLARGDHVRSYSRGDYPELRAQGADTRQGDLTDRQALSSAAQGCDVVFHVAAKAGVWGDAREYEKANVEGTKNVIAACREQGVRALIHTSSPSVTFHGVDQDGVAEDEAPYPEHFLAHYPRTKAEAERLALEANSPELAITALRPHLIWGPGDNHLVPRVLERGRAGRLRLVGDGEKLVDSVYIDNAASAHLQAADRLLTDAEPTCAGRAYFISNGEPMPMRELLDRILDAGGQPPVTRRIPAAAAYCVGAFLEGVYSIFRLAGEPIMTRFVARQLATSHWFDLSAARRDLGYEPLVTVDEGMRRLRESLAAGKETGA